MRKQKLQITCSTLVKLLRVTESIKMTPLYIKSQVKGDISGRKSS